METRSNRLCPTQSMLASTVANHSPSGRLVPPKLTLRRRCRSECLPMGSVMGIATEPKHYDDLNELRRKAPHSPKSTAPTLPTNQQQPLPAVRKHVQHLLKYSPGGILRNHDSSKNIFSVIDTRKNGYMNGTGACLKTYTKENLASAPILMTTANDTAMNSLYAAYNIDRYSDKAYRSEQDVHNKYQCIGTVSQEVLPTNTRTTNCGDNKRRVRSRSESEPHELLYQTKQSPNKCTGRPKLFDTVLKRSRDDNSYLSSRNNVVFDEVAAVAAKPPLSGTTDKQPVVNPNYTKLIGRPCTPRYPIKPLNGLRKLRPRNSLARNKANKAMVVPVPSPNRCPTPAAPSDDTAVIPDEAVNGVVNGITKNDAEESDTGCSSLDDDDDFDDIGEGDFNDSLSESEDSGSLTSQLTTSLDAKLADGTIMTTDCVHGSAVDTSAPLVASLFPHVPPYITFASHSEKGATMPAAVTKVLKWKLTTITPIVIRKVLLNSGFRLLRSE